MEILKIIIETTTAFHTSGGRIGSTIDILRDKYIQNGATKERFIIPATHIKGVLRSEAKRIWGQNKRIVELFGVEEQEGTQGYQEPVLKFTDAWRSNSIVAERTHVSIDRSTGSHTERELFMENVIPARSIFVGFILAREPLSDEDWRILRGSALSASHYGLGKSRSRGLGGVRLELISSSREELIREMSV